MTDTGSGRSTAELADRASRLVSEERWTEALAIYDEALERDVPRWRRARNSASGYRH